MTFGAIEMSVTLRSWLPFGLGAAQLVLCYVIGRNLWPILRRHAPRLLAFRGVPYFVATVLILIVLPGALVIVLLAMSSGTTPPVLAGLQTLGPWIGGLMAGLALCVWYYGPKDLAKHKLRRRANARTRERDGA